MAQSNNGYRGRAAGFNPENEFKEYNYEPTKSQDNSLSTDYFLDHPNSILSENESPDIPFRYSLNPYRGCEHGCIYCYARPTHEYLDFSAGTDFESKIIIKKNAPELLAERFESNNWKPQTVALSGNTDPYQPIERDQALTRDCLKVFLEYRNPVSIVTKNELITRDTDLLRKLGERNLVKIHVSLTTLDRQLCDKMEPRSSRPHRRLKTIQTLAETGVPVGVNAAPMIPGLTDHELPEILKAAAEHGASTASKIMVRLPGTVEELFKEWLSREFPARKDKILNQIRSVRDGILNDAEFGSRMKGSGEHANFQEQLFETTCEKLGLNQSSETLRTDQFRRSPEQRDLFD